MTSTTSKALPLLTVSRWRGYRGEWGEEEGSMSLRNARRTVQHITGFSCNFVHVREGGTDVKGRRKREQGYHPGAGYGFIYED